MTCNMKYLRAFLGNLCEECGEKVDGDAVSGHVFDENLRPRKAIWHTGCAGKSECGDAALRLGHFVNVEASA